MCSIRNVDKKGDNEESDLIVHACGHAVEEQGSGAAL